MRKPLLLLLAGTVLGGGLVALLRPPPPAAVVPGPSPMELALERPVGNISVDGLTLEQALQKIANAAGVRLTVDWAALATVRLHPQVPVSGSTEDRTLADAIAAITPFTTHAGPDLVLIPKADGIVYTVADRIGGEHMLLRCYDVGDLMSAPPAPTTAEEDSPLEAPAHLSRRTALLHICFILNLPFEEVNVIKNRMLVRAPAHKQRLPGEMLAAMRTPTPSRQAPAPGRSAQAVWDVERRMYIPDGPDPATAGLNRRVQEVRFEDVPFEKAIEELARIARVNIRLERNALYGDALTQPIHLQLRDMTVADVLRHVFEQVSFVIRPMYMVNVDGVIHVTHTVDRVYMFTRLYDVRDWPFGAVGVPGSSNSERISNQAELEKFIQRHVDEPSWRDRGGSVGTMSALNGWLVIDQTAETHEKIRDLLVTLRTSPATRPAP